MSTPRGSFANRSVNISNPIFARAQAERARRKEARGAGCTLSELVNEALDAILPPAEGEDVIPIKEVRRRPRAARRLKRPA